MADQMVRTVTTFAILSLLVIEQFDLAYSRNEDNNGLVQLAQKDLGAFLQHTADAAGKSIIKTLNSKFKGKFSYTLQEADLDSLQIWQGQVLDVSIDVGNAPHRIYIGGPQHEAEWLSLRRMLPESQGGIRLKTDWDALESNLVRPLRDGAILPDFTLEGPLDLFLKPPANLQLWLPHSVDAGVQKRVMLRAGAALTVRGARSVKLRRPVNLPDVTLADFIELVTEDKEEKKHAAGLMHLATGLREKAVRHWNISSETEAIGGRTAGDKESEKAKKSPMTPALVALDIDFSGTSGTDGSGKKTGDGKKQGEGTLFAAPNEHNALQKLKVKRMGDGVIEISVRGAVSSTSSSSAAVDESEGGLRSGVGSRLDAESSKALVLGKPGSPYVWPFRKASPETVTSYEHLLRELLSRQIFSPSATKSKAKLAAAAAENKEKSSKKEDGGVSIAADLPLTLQRSSATAVFLMKMELAVLKKPISATHESLKIGKKENEGGNIQQKGKKDKDSPPTPGQLLRKAAGGEDVFNSDDSEGSNSAAERREVYSTIVKIEGSAREGLSFSPVGPLQLVAGQRTSDVVSVAFEPGAVAQLAGELGLGSISNSTVMRIRDEL